MSPLFKRIRGSELDLPMQEEIEQFGADGEESVYRMLTKSFDCVIRNVAVESDTFTANPFVFDKNKTYTFTEAVSGEVRTHTGAELLQNGMTFTMPRKTAQMHNKIV